jgi:hypothetical protein
MNVAIQVIAQRYRQSFGGTTASHERIENVIARIARRTLTHAQHESIKLYNMQGDYYSGAVGTHKRHMKIFINATRKQEPEYIENQAFEVGGEQVSADKLIKPSGIEHAIQITSEDGVVLAEFFKEYDELYIHFDVMNDLERLDSDKKLFEYIMKALNDGELYERTLENSWVHTKNKEALVQRFENRIKEMKANELANMQYQLGESENNERTYRQRLKNALESITRLRRQIEQEQENLNNVSEQFIKDIDLIATHPQVTDVHIIMGVFHVFTDDIYCYDKNNNRYYIGKMKFTMDMENTDIRFFNLNNTRKGFWTDNDPHPHVNGSGGSACLGSASSTIAELSSRNEVYALALTCIDFLENANIDDSAGARVVRWDQVDEEGNIIKKGRGSQAETWTCGECGEEHTMEATQNYVYTSLDGDGDEEEGHYVDNVCLEEHYFFSERVQEHLHNDLREEDEGWSE